MPRIELELPYSYGLTLGVRSKQDVAAVEAAISDLRESGVEIMSVRESKMPLRIRERRTEADQGGRPFRDHHHEIDDEAVLRHAEEEFRPEVERKRIA